MRSFVSLTRFSSASAWLTLVLPVIFIFDSFAQHSRKYEMRGVWIASVVNLDFPSRKDLSAEEQQAEFVQLLDRHQAAGINAVFVQVRPSGDALYPSFGVPFSEWLTGEQGSLPRPYYDPLQFMIQEAHRRGIEFHAWFNPFRAVFNNRTKLSPTHIFHRQPAWFVRYGAQRMFDPGIPEARNYVIRSILEVVMQYDIDGVHLDDYFYPYPQHSAGAFPDDSTYLLYRREAKQTRANWRRSNTDQFVRQLATGIKKLKPWVKIGVSPFGVWRNQSDDPNGSPTRAGITTYDVLYADVRKWLQKGWLDYVVPQLYFSVGHTLAPYEKLLAWWGENSFGKHVYTGQSVFKIQNSGDSAWNAPSEMPEHIRRSRQAENVQGDVFFHSRILDENPGGFRDSLKERFYAQRAFPPPMPWLDVRPPQPPEQFELTGYRKGILLEWQNPNPTAPTAASDQVRFVLVYRFVKGEEINIRDMRHLRYVLDGQRTQFVDRAVVFKEKYIYVITFMDRLSNESAPSLPLYIKYRKKYRKR